MRYIAFIALLIAILVPSTLFAAGSCTYSEASVGIRWFEQTFVITSDGDGNVTNPTCTGNRGVTGEIKRITIIPGTGADQPDSSFNVYLYDGADTTDDILGGLGATSSNTNRKVDKPKTAANSFERYLAAQTLTPKATGMGATNKATIKVLIAPEMR